MKQREFWFDKSGRSLDSGMAFEGTLYFKNFEDEDEGEPPHDYHFVEKSVADKLAVALDEIKAWESSQPGTRLYQICDEALKNYRGEPFTLSEAVKKLTAKDKKEMTEAVRTNPRVADIIAIENPDEDT